MIYGFHFGILLARSTIIKLFPFKLIFSFIQCLEKCIKDLMFCLIVIFLILFILLPQKTQVMQSIGFLGPAFFLSQLGHVDSPAMAVVCMACSQVCVILYE